MNADYRFTPKKQEEIKFEDLYKSKILFENDYIDKFTNSGIIPHQFHI